MNDPEAGAKPTRKVRTIDEEIAFLRDKLKRAENRKREDERKSRERNQRAVMALIAAEQLDLIPAEDWKKSMPQIRTIFRASLTNGTNPSEPVPDSDGAICATDKSVATESAG